MYIEKVEKKDIVNWLTQVYTRIYKFVFKKTNKQNIVGREKKVQKPILYSLLIHNK